MAVVVSLDEGDYFENEVLGTPAPVELNEFKDPIEVPTINNSVTKNILLQSFSILFYSILFIFCLHNTYAYLVKKKRYKVFPITLFYTFAGLLSTARITQHVLSFYALQNNVIYYCNTVADAYSVCIGIA